LDEHDLASRHVEIDPGKGGKAAEQRDRGAEMDDLVLGNGLHETTRGYWRLETPTKAGRERVSARTARTITAVRLARVLGAIGRSMITLGVLILLFVVYQLWGTGIREAQAQDRLQHQFEQQLSDASGGDDAAVVGGSDPSTSSTSTPADSAPPTAPVTVTSVAPAAPSPSEGDVLGKIEIPKIGLSAYVIEGVGVDDLKNGPGHYPGTPLPGQHGNASIAGHRSTYGAPFANVDDLNPGDPITVTTLQGVFHYAVTGQEIVSPDDVQVLDDKGDNELTLTACHPKFSASKRIVIHASLEGTPVVAAPKPDQPAGSAPKPLDANASGKSAPKMPAILYAVLCAAIWAFAWLVGKRWRKWPAYLIGLPFFLVALFYFFESFSRLLPANY
jgi:sortase A